MSHPIYNNGEEKMQKAIEVMTNDFKGIRTGRASSAFVENIKVDYYGSPTPLKQIANIAVPEPRMIIIKPYDQSSLGAIEKAIMTSDTGINPANDGKLIRLNIPPLSEERRKQLSKVARDNAEKTKISIRNIRRDAIRVVEDEEKKKTLTEDAKFKLKDELQKLTEKYEKRVDELLSKKAAEIMEI
ncbi:MAG: ribosome recycling factor [Planctomycetota bacterium]|nr:ribosome recycling factor [Planctomycetota bacterium]MDI6786968.1 ribosome recycling factor [Planctomycetota bacterium]